MIKLGILGSTRGTNLIGLIDAIKKNQLAAKINIVISNKPDAIILQRAETDHLSTLYLPNVGKTREQYDALVSAELKKAEVELVVLIGYMRILSAEFICDWKNKIINVHPSLLPAYAGLMDLAVHQAVLADKQTLTGCTVHYVTEEVDAGPILVQRHCAVFPSDTPELLKSRVQQLEVPALIDAIKVFF